MKTTLNQITLTVFLLLVLISPAVAQDTWAEGWESNVNKRQPPDKVMDAINLKPGMIIGEIGAGKGRYTGFLAKRVGVTGKVYANDINENSLSYLKARCKRNNIDNVEIVVGKVDDPLLPKNALDLVIMVWVYHMLDQPVELIKNLKVSLKPGATLVILDPSFERTGENDSGHPTTKAKILKDALDAGYELVSMNEFLPKDNIFILRVKGD